MWSSTIEDILYNAGGDLEWIDIIGGGDKSLTVQKTAIKFAIIHIYVDWIKPD